MPPGEWPLALGGPIDSRKSPSEKDDLLTEPHNEQTAVVEQESQPLDFSLLDGDDQLQPPPNRGRVTLGRSIDTVHLDPDQIENLFDQ